MESWKKFISGEIYAKHLVPKDFQFIFVQESDNIHYVLNTLTKNHISSAPVLSQDGIIGQIDTLDLVTYIASKFDNQELKENDVVREMMETPIKNIMNLSGRNKLHTLFSNEHIYQIIRMLAKPNIHRVLLANPNNAKHYDGMVTQSQLLQWIYSNRDKANEFMNMKVQDLWPESAGIHWIHEEASLLEAFQLIREKQVSGLAILNKEGKLVGNISASDLKHAGMQSYFEHNLHQLIKDLKTKLYDFLRMDQPIQESGYCPSLGAFRRIKTSDLPKFTPITISPLDNLEKLMNLLINTKNAFDQGHIHRLYVVDSSNKPTHEISLSDVIAQFQQYQGVASQ
jgi:CBS domain-containing protein